MNAPEPCTDHDSPPDVPAAVVRPAPEGLTVRDYFAIHATQPGVAEILNAAGVVLDTDSHEHVQFGIWWGGLSNAERFRFSAIVRYQQADAMLRIREDYTS